MMSVLTFYTEKSLKYELTKYDMTFIKCSILLNTCIAVRIMDCENLRLHLSEKNFFLTIWIVSSLQLYCFVQVHNF